MKRRATRRQDEDSRRDYAALLLPRTAFPRFTTIINRESIPATRTRDLTTTKLKDYAYLPKRRKKELMLIPFECLMTNKKK